MSRDLEEELQGLVDHIHENTGATAVYIGKVVNPLKKIKDDDKKRILSLYLKNFFIFFLKNIFNDSHYC